MIKKRYIAVALVTVSVLLGSLLYSNLALAQKGKEATEVDVINLPIDEQGNLRIKTMVQTSKIVLVFNETITVSSDLYTYHDITSFNTDGYKHGYVMAKAQGTLEENANIFIYAYDNNFGIQTYAGQLSLQTSLPYLPNWGSGTVIFMIHSTSIDLYLQVYNSNVGFDGLLTIVVHLTN